MLQFSCEPAMRANGLIIEEQLADLLDLPPLSRAQFLELYADYVPVSRAPEPRPIPEEVLWG